jgi:AcrR family transcriptional regulator
MSPQNDEQNQQIRDERKEQVLIAALQVFARRGFAAARISDIAAAAGISHGLVYHYFSSKDEMFTVLVERALESSTQITALAAAHPGTPWGKLEWLTNMILSHSTEVSSYYHLIVLQAFTSDAIPETARKLVEARSPVAARHLIPVLEEGQKEGQIVQGDPEQLALLYFCLIQGIVLARIQGAKADQIPSTSMILRALQA